jgi:hypothetical protein
MSITVSDDTELLTVFKSCGNNIVTLKIDPSKDNNLNRPVYDKRYAKYRCKRAYVVSIVNKDDESQTLESIESDYTIRNFEISKVIYNVGEWIEINNYDEDVSKVCASGIHFYTTREAAWYHDKHRFFLPDYNGKIKEWMEDGQPLYTIEYQLGIIRKEIHYNLDGSGYQETEYNENGKLVKESSYFLNGTQTVTHYYHDRTNQTFTLPLQSVQPTPLYGHSSTYRSPVIPIGFGLRVPMVLPSGFGLRVPMVLPSGFGLTVPMVLPYGFGLTVPMVLPYGFSSQRSRSGVQFQPVVHPTHFY